MVAEQDQFMTLRQAARHLGCSRTYVQQCVRLGKLSSRSQFGQPRIWRGVLIRAEVLAFGLRRDQQRRV
jgi:hypothetical protein